MRTSAASYFETQQCNIKNRFVTPLFANFLIWVVLCNKRVLWGLMGYLAFTGELQGISKRNIATIGSLLSHCDHPNW